MKTYNLIIQPIAARDIDTIGEYIAKDNPKAAIKLLKEIYKSFNNLCSHPNMGFIKDKFKYKNVRFYKVKKHYLIAYNFENDEINILRVLSSYQDIIDKL